MSKSGRWARTPLFAVTALVVLGGLAIASAFSWLLGGIAFGWWNPLSLSTVPDAGVSFLEPVKIALTIAAGIGAAVALVVAYRKQRLAERQEPREQYLAAVSQIGDSNSTVRLAGVYALANLADDHLNMAQQCVDVLCGHLRIPWEDRDGGEQRVRETILRVIAGHVRGRRRADPGAWSHLNYDLTNATLPEFNFFRATFTEEVNFHGATFPRIHEEGFDEVTFVKDVWFTAATFAGPVSFGFATFRAAAGFDGAKFLHKASFVGADFSYASFDDAQFADAVSFEGATFGWWAGFTDATFSGESNFRRAVFAETAWLRGARFGDDADFGDARFHDLVLSEASFGAGAKFDGVAFDDLREPGLPGLLARARRWLHRLPTHVAPPHPDFDGSTFSRGVTGLEARLITSSGPAAGQPASTSDARSSSPEVVPAAVEPDGVA